MFTPPPLPRSLAASFRDLESKRSDVRASAIVDVTRHARTDAAVRRDAVLALTTKMEDPAAEVRAGAAVALGDLGAVESIEVLLGAVDDPHPHVRQMALNALGELGDPRAIGRLERATTDDRAEVRYQAVIALSRLAPPAGVDQPRLWLMASNDEDEAVRHIALRLAEEHVEAGGSLDERLVMRAATLLADEHVDVAMAAAILLAKANDDRGHDRIRAAVTETLRPRPSLEEEREAVELAGRLGFVDLIPTLEKRAWGLGRVLRDTCAWHAKVALARLGHARATAEILADLDADSEQKRSTAIVASGRAKLVQAKERLDARARGDAEEAQLARQALRDLEAP